MNNIAVLILLSFSCKSISNAQEKCLMPQGWYSLKPFGWHSGTVEDSTIRHISAVKISLNINHSWGAGDEQFAVEYKRRDTIFTTSKTYYKSSGRVYPPNRRGEGAVEKDSFFDRNFKSEQLFRVLRNIQQPSPYWQESDFGYTKSKFRTDLTQLIRSEFSVYRTCDDCSYYRLEIQFLKDEEKVSTISINFDSGFRLPKVEDTALKKFQIRQMLEWMYLYQLSHLFFSDDLALNKSHFQKKRINDLAVWARQYFPEFNK